MSLSLSTFREANFHLPTQIFKAEKKAQSLERRSSAVLELSLSEAAHLVDLPPTTQEKVKKSDGFYPEMLDYVEAVKRSGAAAAARQLEILLRTQLESADREAKRKELTMPVFLKVVFDEAGDSGQIQLSRFGSQKDWREELRELLARKPAGKERDLFELEINQVLAAFEKVLAFLPNQAADVELKKTDEEVLLAQLVEKESFTEVEIEVTKVLVSFFPNLAGQFGQKIKILASPQLLSVYPPSDFHLKGISSFAYLKRLAYVPQNGWVVIDQGLFSGYQDQDLLEMLQFFGANNPEAAEQLAAHQAGLAQLIEVIIELGPEYSALAPAVFKMFTDFYGFKEVPKAEGIPLQLNSDYSSFINLLKKIFDWEIMMVAENPKRAVGLQERITTFSRFIMFGLASNNPVPEEMFDQYLELFAENSRLARSPEKYYQKIDTEVAGVFGALNFAGLFDMASVFDCSVVGMFQLGSSPFSMMPALEMQGLMSQFSAMDLLNKGKLKDFAKKVGKDAKRFTQRSTCVMCHKEAWVDPPGSGTGCGVCMRCEVEDDLGRVRAPTTIMERDFNLSQNVETRHLPHDHSSGATTLNNLVATLI